MAGSAEMVIATIVRVGTGRDVPGVCAVVPGVFGHEVAFGNAGGWLYTWRALLYVNVV